MQKKETLVTEMAEKLIATFPEHFEIATAYCTRQSQEKVCGRPHTHIANSYIGAQDPFVTNHVVSEKFRAMI